MTLSSNNNIQVSIIMPAYNAEAFIKESIDSVLNQTYENWELIVIDDGSKDNTNNIIETYNDSRIKVINQRNQGVSAARNAGLKIATGNWITFLDADDLFPPESIEKRLKLAINDNVDSVIGGVEKFSDKKNNSIEEWKPNFTGNPLSELVRLNSDVFYGIPSIFIKKTKLSGIKFQETLTHGEDLYFFIEIANKQSITVSSLNDTTYLHRVSHFSAMSNLKGLEKGYWNLFELIKKNIQVDNNDVNFLKLRIIRIMTLSYLSKKQFILALKTIPKIFTK